MTTGIMIAMVERIVLIATVLQALRVQHAFQKYALMELIMTVIIESTAWTRIVLGTRHAVFLFQKYATTTGMMIVILLWIVETLIAL